MVQVKGEIWDDVLVRCVWSGRLAWVRLRSSSGDDRDVSYLTAGDVYFVTNLKPKLCRGSLPLYQSLRGSDFHRLRPLSSTDVTSSCKRGRDCGYRSIKTEFNPYLPVSSLRALVVDASDSSTTKVFHNDEVTVEAYIVHWELPESRSVSNMKGSAQQEHLRIFLTDESHVVLLITYALPPGLICSLSWLQLGRKLLVRCMLLSWYDKEFEVIHATRLERTEIVAEQNAVVAHGRECALTKKGQFLIPPVLNSDFPLEHFQDLLFEEGNRCRALCAQSPTYTLRGCGRRAVCSRQRLFGCTVQISLCHPQRAGQRVVVDVVSKDLFCSMEVHHSVMHRSVLSAARLCNVVYVQYVLDEWDENDAYPDKDGKEIQRCDNTIRFLIIWMEDTNFGAKLRVS